MAQSFWILSLVFLVIGLPAAVAPYRTSKFGEQLDAIGSKTPRDEIEPTETNVIITRFVGVFMSALGVAYLFA